jgi:hypothetical protein
MRNVALITVLVVVGFAHTALGSPRRGPSLSVVRICSGAYQDEKGECIRDQRKRLLLYPEVRCSVRVDTPRPTRFTAQILYRGRVERSYGLVLSGRRTRGISVAFPELGGDDYGVPGGAYTCRFTLGGIRAFVKGVSRGKSTRVRGESACTVHDGGERPCTDDSAAFSPPRTLACTVVLVGWKGRATTQIQRRAGEGWNTVYAASDAIRVPIAEVWAYSSAQAGRRFESGDYRCRFLVGSAEVAQRLFVVH